MAGPLQATFPTSSVEGSTSCVGIDILQDMAFESNHSFGVEVISATPSVVVVGTPSEETVTILDDESMCTMKCYLMFTIGSVHINAFEK